MSSDCSDFTDVTSCDLSATAATIAILCGEFLQIPIAVSLQTEGNGGIHNFSFFSHDFGLYVLFAVSSGGLAAICCGAVHYAVRLLAGFRLLRDTNTSSVL